MLDIKIFKKFKTLQDKKLQNNFNQLDSLLA